MHSCGNPTEGKRDVSKVWEPLGTGIYGGARCSLLTEHLFSSLDKFFTIAGANWSDLLCSCVFHLQLHSKLVLLITSLSHTSTILSNILWLPKSAPCLGEALHNEKYKPGCLGMAKMLMKGSFGFGAGCWSPSQKSLS